MTYQDCVSLPFETIWVPSSRRLSTTCPGRLKKELATFSTQRLNLPQTALSSVNARQHLHPTLSYRIRDRLRRGSTGTSPLPFGKRSLRQLFGVFRTFFSRMKISLSHPLRSQRILYMTTLTRTHLASMVREPVRPLSNANHLRHRYTRLKLIVGEMLDTSRIDSCLLIRSYYQGMTDPS
jgi:hypothetical protein